MSSNWRLVRAFLKSLILSVVVATVVSALIGFLLAGLPGLANMAIWGIAFGLVGGTMTGLAAMSAKRGEEIGGNFSRWQEREEAKKQER